MGLPIFVANFVLVPSHFTKANDAKRIWAYPAFKLVGAGFCSSRLRMQAHVNGFAID